MSTVKLPNGGFPPVILCEKQNKQSSDYVFKKERFFAPTLTKDINIRKIVNLTKRSVPIIDDSQDTNILEEVDDI